MNTKAAHTKAAHNPPTEQELYENPYLEELMQREEERYFDERYNPIEDEDAADRYHKQDLEDKYFPND